jgi:hypothetical protein
MEQRTAIWMSRSRPARVAVPLLRRWGAWWSSMAALVVWALVAGAGYTVVLS